VLLLSIRVNTVSKLKPKKFVKLLKISYYPIVIKYLRAYL